jgi:hypothetical protein
LAQFAATHNAALGAGGITQTGVSSSTDTAGQVGVYALGDILLFGI